MTTITAEATAAELLAELRELVNRYDGAATLDDVRQLADEVTQRLRRARGRITRIARQLTITEAPTPPVVEPKSAAPAPKATPEPAPAVKESLKAAEPAPTPPESAPPAVSTPPASPRPAPRRTSWHVALAVLTVVSSLWSTTSTRTRRTVRAIRSTSRRAGRLATAVRTAVARLGGAS